MPRTRNKWDEKNINRLKKMLIIDPNTNQVLNYMEVAEAFKVKHGAVKRIVIMLRKRGELPEYDRSKQFEEHLRPYTESEKRLIAGMFSQGMTVREVADQMNRTVNGIRDLRMHLARDGMINYKCKPWTDDEITRLIINYHTDENLICMSLYRLSMITGHPHDAVAYKVHVLREQGILPYPRKQGAPKPVWERYHKMFKDQMANTFRRWD